MTAAGEASPTEEVPDLQLEFRALMQFLHLAPVGLIRARLDGRVRMMNPRAAQLLGPLCMGGDGEEGFNLFTLLAPVCPGLKARVQAHRRPSGVVCEGLRLLMPEQPADAGVPVQDGAPLALGLTIVRLSADPDALMAVLADQSAQLRLDRLLDPAGAAGEGGHAGTS